MRRLCTFVPAAMLLAFSVPLAGMIMAAPREQAATAAVFFPPWTGSPARMDIIVRADAVPVRSGVIPFIWVVRSDRPGLPGRLRRAGALLILDPEAAWGCAAAEKAKDAGGV